MSPSICCKFLPHLQKMNNLNTFIGHRCACLFKDKKNRCVNMTGKRSSSNAISINKPCILLCRTINTGPLQTASSLTDFTSFNEMKLILNEDLDGFDHEITQLLQTSVSELREMCCYYFDGKGKSLRPLTVFLMARACNYHHSKTKMITESQRKVALISEMIHIGSLIHDDVIDLSNVRRGKSSVNYICGDKNAVMAGNYIMAIVSCLLAEIDNTYVTTTITTIIDDLVKGEFMQENSHNRFDHYLKKTYKKTASLIANCCKAVASLSSCDQSVVESAYQYGKNIGIAFQLIDDLLDFVATSETLGKPAAADLKLGLATAPVLFACEKYPELNEMITRRFQGEGDVDRTLQVIAQSDAIEETRQLADEYCKLALKELSNMDDSLEVSALAQLPKIITNRSK